MTPPSQGRRPAESVCDVSVVCACADIVLSTSAAAATVPAAFERVNSLAADRQPAAQASTLARSVSLEPSVTAQLSVTMTPLTVRRRRNLATAERARVRLQCLHQVRKDCSRWSGWALQLIVSMSIQTATEEFTKVHRTV